MILQAVFSRQGRNIVNNRVRTQEPELVIESEPDLNKDGMFEIIGGAISNLISGEGRERRQQRRAERRERRAARREKRAVKQTQRESWRAGSIGYGYPSPAIPEALAPDVPAQSPTMNWMKQNWPFLAGGGAALLVIVFLLSKKKSRPVRRRKHNPGNPGHNPRRKPRGGKSTRKSFAARAKHVNKMWAAAKAKGSRMGRKAAWAKWG